MIEITTEDHLAVEDEVRREALYERQCADRLCILDYVEVNLPEPREAAVSPPLGVIWAAVEPRGVVTAQPRGPPSHGHYLHP